METKSDKKFLKTALTLSISVGIAVFFMWLALRDTNFEEIRQAFMRANYFWIFLALVAGVLAYWVRAVRWKLLLKPLGYTISTSNAFWTIAFGYLLNLTIPRSGEIARATALYGVEKVTVDESFGTIIVERVVDLFFMALLFLLTAIFKYDALYAFWLQLQAALQANPDKKGFPLSLILLAAAILGAVLLWSFRKRLQKAGITDKIVNFLRGILKGILSISKLEQKGLFLFQSLAIWVCYFFAAYLICFALPETSDFGLADGCFIIAVGTLGMLIPASGGFGTFHTALKLGISALFLAWGRDPELGAQVGLQYAFLSHTLQIVIMLVAGLLAIPILARRRIRRMAEPKN